MVADYSKAWEKLKDYLQGAADAASGEYNLILNKMIEIESEEPTLDDKLISDFVKDILSSATSLDETP